ncbi:MAG TPA: histidine--tRNA ligase [Candidatus Wirthbacteria bacterium]|nr:histidine--tRNA ligase [Candidatus Wirthbacteria bacterium]
MIEPKILKGFRDFLPAEALNRQYVMDIIKKTFESYGFDPIETPALEYLETFQGNIGEDERLFYKFEDYGGREVALRYDQTVPTCRFVAQYQHELAFPWKRYQIQTVWRADKPQKGRYREFIQCDIDIFGLTSALADAETIAITINAYQNLGFKDFKVKISDRALYAGIEYPVIVAIDKLAKIGRQGAIDKIISKGYSQTYAEETLARLANLEPNDTLKTIFDYLDKSGFDAKHYEFDRNMARSFSYSTGPIWEVEIVGFDSGSVGGGERYDQLVSRFSRNDIPGTGIAFGFDRTIEAMKELDLLPHKSTVAQVLMTVFSPETLAISLKFANKLRQAGINVDTYTDTEAKLGKQLKYADKKTIPYVIIIGPEEESNNQAQIKNMHSGEQLTLDQTQVANWLKVSLDL